MMYASGQPELDQFSSVALLPAGAISFRCPNGSQHELLYTMSIGPWYGC